MATAFARKLFPVPGGPYSKKPLQAFRFPVKNWGNFTGKITASFSASFAASKPATSSDTLGFSVTMAEPTRALRIFGLVFVAALAAAPPPPLFGFARSALSGLCAGFALFVAASPSINRLSSSARSRYSVNLVLMVCCIIGFFSYLR